MQRLPIHMFPKRIREFVDPGIPASPASMGETGMTVMGRAGKSHPPLQAKCGNLIFG